MKKIEIKKLFTKSFKIYKENWFNFLLIGILLGLISLVSHFSGLGINQTTGELVFGTSAIVAIIAWFVSTYLSVGVIRYTLDLIDGKKVKLKRIFYGIDSIEHMVYVVLVALITTVLVLSGLVFVIIPVILNLFISTKIIWVFALISSIAGFLIVITSALGLLFTKYFIAENRGEVLVTIKKSWEMTKGHKLKLLGLIIILAAFNLLGLLILMIGLVVTIPVSALVIMGAYRSLDEQNHSQRTIELENSSELVDNLENKKQAE